MREGLERNERRDWGGVREGAGEREKGLGKVREGTGEV